MQPTRKTQEYLATLRTLSLDERAKTRMRDALDAYADLHTMQPAPSRVSYFSAFSYSRAAYGSFALIALLLVSGTGIAYASEGSVPGSPLYPVKVSVVEPVQGALITSPQGQAAWHAELATRRLEEATTLAVRGKLDDEKQVYLQDQFEAQVASSNEAAESLAVAGKTDAAIDARSDLEARITAHAELLTLLSDHLETTNASTSPSLRGTKALLALVELRKNEATEARLALEDSHDGDPTISVATLARAEVTTNLVSNQAAKGNAIAPVAMRVTAAKAALYGAQNTALGDRTEAYQKAHEAERSSEVASILLKNATLLRSFATTTATSTATTTATTTIEVQEKGGKD